MPYATLPSTRDQARFRRQRGILSTVSIRLQRSRLTNENWRPAVPATTPLDCPKRTGRFIVATLSLATPLMPLTIACEDAGSRRPNLARLHRDVSALASIRVQQHALASLVERYFRHGWTAAWPAALAGGLQVRHQNTEGLVTRAWCRRRLPTAFIQPRRR